MEFKKEFGAYAVGRRANQEEWNTITRVAEDTIGFGVPVTEGSGRRGVSGVISDGDTILGITEASQVLPHTGDNYLKYDNVGICEWGVIGVLLAGNAAKGAAALYDITTNDEGWRSTGGTAANVFTVPGATFEEGGVKGDIVPVRYRRPNPSIASDQVSD